MSRPDRIALWAVLLCVTLMLAAAASSHAAVRMHHSVHAPVQTRQRELLNR